MNGSPWDPGNSASSLKFPMLGLRKRSYAAAISCGDDVDASAFGPRKLFRPTHNQWDGESSEYRGGSNQDLPFPICHLPTPNLDIPQIYPQASVGNPNTHGHEEQIGDSDSQPGYSVQPFVLREIYKKELELINWEAPTRIPMHISTGPDCIPGNNYNKQIVLYDSKNSPHRFTQKNKDCTPTNNISGGNTSVDNTSGDNTSADDSSNSDEMDL